MLSKLPFIGRVLGIVLGVIGVIMFIMVSLNEDSASSYVSYGLFTTVVGIVIAVLSFVLSLTVNPKGNPWCGYRFGGCDCRWYFELRAR